MMYKQMVKDPLTESKKMYEYFNIKFTDKTERNLKSYLANDPKKKKYGVHRYTREDFGITMERLKKEFAVYDKYMSQYTDDVI